MTSIPFIHHSGAIITERLLQFIWQFQYYNTKELQSSEGELIRVLHPGMANQNQGPDFLQARVKIGDTILAGNIEIHLQSKDWWKHGHQSDEHYRNIILHVVWEENSIGPAKTPVLELQNRVSRQLLNQYYDWMQQQQFIPCQHRAKEAGPLIWTSWKERLLVERMDRKAARIHTMLEQNKFDWEETFWILLAKHFGSKVNAAAFEAIARSLPYRRLQRHKSQLITLESLLLGQAGLLNGNFQEDYPVLLQQEYRHLRKKYRLDPISQGIFFLRMRPVNFPTVRLAQLAQLLHQSEHLFAQLRDCTDLNRIRQLLEVTANDYWHYHYRLDEAADYHPKRVGTQMTTIVLLNAICPLLFAYARACQEPVWQNRAMEWISQLPSEHNQVIARFHQLGISSKNAADSQALLELRSQYCEEKRCLDCAIGNRLLLNATT